MNFIIRPATLEKVSIFSQQGKLLLKQYINTYNNYKLQIGGSRGSRGRGRGRGGGGGSRGSRGSGSRGSRGSGRGGGSAAGKSEVLVEVIQLESKLEEIQKELASELGYNYYELPDDDGIYMDPEQIKKLESQLSEIRKNIKKTKEKINHASSLQGKINQDTKLQKLLTRQKKLQTEMKKSIELSAVRATPEEEKKHLEKQIKIFENIKDKNTANVPLSRSDRKIWNQFKKNVMRQKKVAESQQYEPSLYETAMAEYIKKHGQAQSPNQRLPPGAIAERLADTHGTFESKLPEDSDGEDAGEDAGEDGGEDAGEDEGGDNWMYD